ncbi:hypothetical protein RB653_005834 [Dictyostelium firmibasis]|uniref:Uncharacterized protein n=1 Tax=Dictyostelium firmibasis TaxID=79012 RepID=A0AAN7YZM5_9MYCE
MAIKYEKEMINSNNGINYKVDENLPNSYFNSFQPMKIEVFNNTKEDDKKVWISLTLFILGFFLIIPWSINVIHLNCNNRMARGFGIASFILFSIISITSIFLSVLFIFLFWGWGAIN